MIETPDSARPLRKRRAAAFPARPEGVYQPRIRPARITRMSRSHVEVADKNPRGGLVHYLRQPLELRQRLLVERDSMTTESRWRRMGVDNGQLDTVDGNDSPQVRTARRKLDPLVLDERIPAQEAHSRITGPAHEPVGIVLSN